jgi:hypothetical protein
MNYFNYFTEIEEEFVKRRGSHMLISPLDWSLIETWKQRGLPLHIVLRGINAAFDLYDAKARHGRKVNSLFYCRQEVEALFLEYAAARVGGNGQAQTANGGQESDEAVSSFSPEAIIAYLTERYEEIAQLRTSYQAEEPLTETLTRALERLQQIIEDLKTTRAVAAEQLETDLSLIEELLLEGLKQHAGAAALGQLTREGNKQLRAYRDGMAAEVYEQTLNNYVARRLREQYRVPRLSLFYL